MATIEEAGFKDISILDEREYCFEELGDDPHTKVIVANPTSNTQELKSISKLDEKSKGIIEEVLASTLSITVSALKP